MFDISDARCDHGDTILYSLFSACVIFWNDKITLLRTACALWGIPDSLGQFAGVGALFTRAFDKFTADTFNALLFIMHIINNFQYLFLRRPLWSLCFK